MRPPTGSIASRRGRARASRGASGGRSNVAEAEEPAERSRRGRPRLPCREPRISGREREHLRVRREIHGDPAIRAIDARRIEALEDELRVAPAAFDRDHAATLTESRDT